MGKRILVADDSVTIQRAFAMVFAVEDVSLIAARSWEEAMALTRQHRPDLVFADVNLGDRSGYDLCSAIKSDGTLASVQVHILASNQVPYDASKGNHARADGHFLKPFDSAKLVEAVNKAFAVSAPVAVERAPAAPMVEISESTSRVQIDDVSFEDEDSYGEFSIESTATAAPPQMKTPPPQVQPPRPMAPAMSRPLPVTPPPVVLPQAARPPMPAASAPIPRPAPPVVSAPMARPSTSMPNVSAPAARAAAPMASAPAPRPAAAAASAPITARAMPRPSLIPGVMPPRVSSDAPVPMIRPTATSAPVPATGDFSRTVMGMPAVSQPVIPVPMPRSEVVTARETPAVKGLGQGLFDDLGLPPSRSPEAPAPVAPVVEPPTPIAARTSERAPTGRISDRVAEQVNDKLSAKMAELSARGPEYEAIAKLSREIIEQIVWEVVPELAEVMIKEHIERLAKR